MIIEYKNIKTEFFNYEERDKKLSIYYIKEIKATSESVQLLKGKR